MNYGVGDIVGAIFHLRTLMVESGAHAEATAAGIANGDVVVEIEFAALLSGFVVVNIGDNCWSAAYEKHVGAEVEYFFSHIVVEPADYADHGDHRHDADDHAQ